jgi:hypothetical protein
MFNQIFPDRVDNAYRGNRLALWLFASVVLLKVGLGLNSIFNGDLMATSGDGIPLDTFAPACARTVVSLYALWGLAHLTLGLLCFLVLLRYRTMIPLMFALLLLEQLSRGPILHFLPLGGTGSGMESPGISPFPYGFLALMILGLALSLRGHDDSRVRE